MADPISIRDGRESDAETLSALVLRSKAHWGYDEEFMARVTNELRVTEEMAARSRVAYGEDLEVLGMCLIKGDGPVAELDMLFVDPSAMGAGVGARLLDDAKRQAYAAGIATLELDADPNAEAFYAKHGAVVIGQTPGSGPGRFLPRMSISTG